VPTALANGINLHYYRRPGRPHVVLVHGLATSLAFWFLRVLPVLDREWGVLLYDLRGHGRSDMPASGYTTADMAEDLHALLTHLDLERVHLIGHSYGGAVALHYTVLYPERVASLVLADARVRALQPSQRVKDWPQAGLWDKEVRALGVEDTDNEEMGYRYLEALAEAKQRVAPVRRPPAGRFSPFGLGRGRNPAAESWLRLLRTTSARKEFVMEVGLTVDRINTVKQPVLAMFGEESHCLPSYRGLQTHLPNCRGVLVPRAGHFHPVVRPFFFARAVRRFIEESA
jgi:pimeloyl-ACP methyl ester carboxylesterase